MLDKGHSLCFQSLQEFDLRFAGKHSKGSVSVFLSCAVLYSQQQPGDPLRAVTAPRHSQGSTADSGDTAHEPERNSIW